MWILLAAAATALLVYLISCRWWPITHCGRCGGSGKIYGPSSIISSRKVFKTCKRCAGTGGRLRVGRRVMNSLGRGARNL